MFQIRIFTSITLVTLFSTVVDIVKCSYQVLIVLFVFVFSIVFIYIPSCKHQFIIVNF